MSTRRPARYRGARMRPPNASAVAVADLAAPAAVTNTDPTVCVRPFRFDPELTVEVPVVRWPDGAVARARHTDAGVACLLLVGATERAPARWSELEDWVRETAPRAEVVTRALTVARRADRLERPRVVHRRMVRFRDRTVAVPEAQAPLVASLVARFGETVSDAEVRARCGDGGVSMHHEAVKTALRRLKDTVA